MTEDEELLIDDQIENFIDYIHGRAPHPPDLSLLPAHLVKDTMALLLMVELLANMGPASPPFENDPVACRLGFHGPECDPGRHALCHGEQ